MSNQHDNSPGQFPETTQKPATSRRRMILWLLGITIFVLLSIIVSQQLWLWTVIPLDTASDTVLLYALSTLNFVAFVVLSFIFVRNLIKLRRERRERELGSKIKTRLLVYFVSISFLPIIAMAVFSYLFLNRSLEKWFGNLPARVVSEAREVAREAEARNLNETASLLAVVLNNETDSERQETLDRIVASGQLAAVDIVDSQGRVVTRSRSTLPVIELEELEKRIRESSGSGPTVHTLPDGKDLHSLVVPLADLRQMFVVTIRQPDTELDETIVGSQGEYRKLVQRQRRVRMLGLSTLGLMTLMMLFVSSWVAIYLARGIATPIKALAEASKEVARGNLSHRVSTMAEDELALLADSFNRMTSQLEDNRTSIESASAALREKNLTLEERRDYIETVLESLSTGVISLDEDDRVTTINSSAARILRFSPVQTKEARLPDLISAGDWVVLDRLIRRARRTGQAAEQAQLSGSNNNGFDSNPIPVALTAAALRPSHGSKRGVVLVLEDLSELLSAQRAAAWSEVARRMAHEIKNPLTPIQLSAERIAKSFRRVAANGGSNGWNGQNGKTSEELHVAEVIDECTQTIAREVAGLKALVDEFSRFARLPSVRPASAGLNEIIRHAVALYDDGTTGIKIETSLDPKLPPAMLDSEQMRRVFVNLIDNAQNALKETTGEKRIQISTNYDAARSIIVAEVSDSGHGIQPADFQRLFQPYFSTRGGAGLGLAIVQKILLEHGGRIRAMSNEPRGAKFVIELPA